jgi:hypothetical protein
MIIMPYGCPWPINAVHRPGRLLAPHRAGHSPAVLLKIYTKCTDGQDQIAKRRVEDALRDPGEPGGDG